MSRAVMCHVMGAADTWPPFFREDGYRGLMQQLQKHGVTYKEVHGIAQASRDAERFKGYLAVPLSEGEALDFHGDISTLWRLCKDTPPGKHPPPTRVDEAALHGNRCPPHAARCRSPSCGAAAHTMRVHLGTCVSHRQLT